ncbi:MAG: imidazoleglycerol-phosphate dehydratase HisB [Anaerosomatales bacterium]|nr:imidazoleglycerol-phosphate dehydratase HisB [Anaerosomatales bacterium]
MPDRAATVTRATSETDITVRLGLDGDGSADVATGVPFFDHMLEALGRHGLFALEVRAEGDLEVDAHHTVEDVGICLGQAFAEALGDKRGIRRFGSAAVPMDEALVLAAVDISGRGHVTYAVTVPIEIIGTFDTTLAKEFVTAFAMNAGVTVHLHSLAGENAHHIIEAAFKALARALREACDLDERVTGIPSTKGAL